MKKFLGDFFISDLATLHSDSDKTRQSGLINKIQSLAHSLLDCYFTYSKRQSFSGQTLIGQKSSFLACCFFWPITNYQHARHTQDFCICTVGKVSVDRPSFLSQGGGQVTRGHLFYVSHNFPFAVFFLKNFLMTHKTIFCPAPWFILFTRSRNFYSPAAFNLKKLILHACPCRCIINSTS